MGNIYTDTGMPDIGKASEKELRRFAGNLVNWDPDALFGKSTTADMQTGQGAHDMIGTGANMSRRLEMGQPARMGRALKQAGLDPATMPIDQLKAYYTKYAEIAQKERNDRSGLFGALTKPSVGITAVLTAGMGLAYGGGPLAAAGQGSTGINIGGTTIGATTGSTVGAGGAWLGGGMNVAESLNASESLGAGMVNAGTGGWTGGSGLINSAIQQAGSTINRVGQWANEHPYLTRLATNALTSVASPDEYDIMQGQANIDTRAEEEAARRAAENTNASGLKLGVKPSGDVLRDADGNPIYNQPFRHGILNQARAA